MNKTEKFNVWQTLLATMLMILISSCGLSTEPANTPTSTPTYDWQPLPTYLYEVSPSDLTTYTHFTPSEKSQIQLEFDYPSSWPFYEHINEVGGPTIGLNDPRFLTLATPSPEDHYHPTPNDLGDVFIWIIPEKPGRTVESEAEDIKQSYRDTWWATFLDDYKIAIDGFGVRVIEHQIQQPEIHTSLMFERRMYFYAQNKLYEIRFTVSEKERGGDFEQGYEYFINSLKIIP